MKVTQSQLPCIDPENRFRINPNNRITTFLVGGNDYGKL